MANSEVTTIWFPSWHALLGYFYNTIRICFIAGKILVCLPLTSTDIVMFPSWLLLVSVHGEVKTQVGRKAMEGFNRGHGLSTASLMAADKP